MSFSSGRNISNNVNTDEAQTLTNKTIDSANNSLVIDADTATVSNIEADNLKAGVIDNDLSSTSVNDDTVPSAKAAKAYTDAAASTASSNLTTHETSTTGVHGVTGDIVGTSDTQTLTNKTITGADIRTPARADVKQDTRANLEVYATTATDGQIVYATDEKKYFGTKDNALVSLGGGLGSPQTVSVISADDLQAASDFSAQNTDIVTGGVVTNGTLNGTLSLSDTASEMLTGIDKVIKYVAGAASQFDYFGHTHAIPQGFAGRTLAVELTYRTAAGYTNGDFSVEILSFNGTTASYLSNKVKLLDSKESADGNGETVRFLVNVPSDAESLKVAFQNLSATSGITFFVDKISVDIDDFNYKQVNAVTEWISFTPTWTVQSGTNPATSTDDAWYRRVGDTLEIKYNRVFSGTGNAGAGFLLTLPLGLTADSAKINIGGSGTQGLAGYGSWYDGSASTKDQSLSHFLFDSTSVSVLCNTGDDTLFANTVASGDRINGHLTVPIQGWQATTKHVVVDSGDAETEVVHYDGIAGYGSAGNTKIPYFTNQRIDTSNEFISIGNDSTNGFTITALKDVVIEMTFSSYHTAQIHSGITLNSSERDTNVQALTNEETRKCYSANSGQTISCSTSVKMAAGDILRPHTNGVNPASSKDRFSVVLTARKATLGEYHLVPVTDQENVFSARITNNGTAAIDVQNTPWIESVSRTAPGTVEITLKSGMFTVAPIVTLGAEDNGTFNDISAFVNSSSSTLISISTGHDGVTLTDRDFNITVQKQGADYKEPKAFIGNVPLNYTQTKYLGSDQTGAGVDLITFNNLVPGKLYKLEVHVLWVATSDTFQAHELVDGSNTTISSIPNHGAGGAGNEWNVHIRTITAPSDGIVKLRTISSMSAAVKGLGDERGTHIVLTELNHTQETTRF